MIQSWKLLRLGGVDFRIHWTVVLIPPLVAASSWWQFPAAEAITDVAVLLAVMVLNVLHELLHLATARAYGIHTRDIILFPVGAVSRSNRLNDRPIEDIAIAAVGPLFHAAVAGLLALTLRHYGFDLLPVLAVESFDLPGFANRLMWANVLLTAFHLLPCFPLDGGRIARAVIATLTTRLRASDIVAHLGSVAAISFVAGAVLWAFNPFLVVIGLYLYLLSQQEMMTEQYFASLRNNSEGPQVIPGTTAPQLSEIPYWVPSANMYGTPVIYLPIDQVVDSDSRPKDDHYTGFTWSARTRLWIEWRDGSPVSANALLGD